ncbi:MULTISPECIES: acyl-CoA dehydrogenase family protein [Streptomyces]|uniref:Acyl-CoA dehydrogenase family protein n=1 Tax=Streptomyces caniscabiei TaxID=2746961 RepID=A0ABU4N333_9ACTN|nr:MULTISPECIES: acyl-CoA dehydrogenase family protein [Streptomyces]MBE4734505.1 acyl-CoA dehydrogenase family protein [Streptomyces caniscabiei]MBE4755376.1 acyl-CoA dehydrogenase family protein [Streptomyces caniscabiei]MBE4772500.1 acyl-CoA dehydrogenase family protein [Streptomyces caniscabiei]MBE4783339.1 acyl-CoA dehydrogenase family protein [Streptomyces caniscabiei]MBE4792643.1 acyl-CoA dehydrogenase family protein [Streptomyces caniscabiei]
MASSTHEVTNQAPPLVDYDVFTADKVLAEAVERHLAPEVLAEARDELTGFGRTAGSRQVQEWGRLADENPPKLRAYDRYGNRVDEVEFHPSWHRLLGKGVSAGLTAAWNRPGGHVRRAAAFVVWTQVEAGNGCPLSMTHAAVPALRTDPALAAEWEPRLTSRLYDWDMRPAGQKAGALFGMGMTEKQGGSDVRANTSVARPLAEDGTYELTGHKWFCSAPMSDGFLVLAQAPGGLTCFLVPRVLADGSRNVFRIQRLKEKLGNRSNASAEVEFDGTWARRVGDEGSGVRTIIGMVAATRLDCALGAASLMRQAVAQAVHHCSHREAFGGRLVDKPLMRNVLADLALESEAATTLAMRLAAAYDAAEAGDGYERSFLRLAVPVAKYWVTKRCAPLVVEASECLGGNGYVEESGMPRLVRESPLNSVWEGAGNVQALDVLRALQREPQALDAYLREVGRARGADHRLDGAIKGVLTELADLDGIEARARRLVERLALVLQGALLTRFAPPAVADAFCASRLGGDWGAAFGTLPHTLDLASVVTRARPVS